MHAIPIENRLYIHVRIGQSGWSEAIVVVRVNHGPFKGKCSISPEVGVEGQTPFMLICYEWKDQDDGHLPLTYQIAFRMTPFDQQRVRG